MVTAIGICQRCESPVERGDLRCAICAQAIPQAEARREEVEVQILRCAGCGAAIEYDPAVQAPRCAFCDSVMHLERIADPMEQTELFLPFTIDREDARRAVGDWLGTLGWFRPPDLRQKARVEDVRPLWWVGWAFDAEALVSWTADSNEGARRASWAPHSGQERMHFDDIVVSASRGLTDVETTALVPSYDLADAVPEVQPPEGTTSEQFDVQRSQARERIVAAIQRLAADIVEHDHVPGSRTRKVKITALLSALVTRRYSFPAYVMAYRYEGTVYRAVVCGQDASVVHGRAPYSFLRIALAVTGGLLLLAAIVLAIVLVS